MSDDTMGFDESVIEDTPPDQEGINWPEVALDTARGMGVGATMRVITDPPKNLPDLAFKASVGALRGGAVGFTIGMSKQNPPDWGEMGREIGDLHLNHTPGGQIWQMAGELDRPGQAMKPEFRPEPVDPMLSELDMESLGSRVTIRDPSNPAETIEINTADLGTMTVPNPAGHETGPFTVSPEADPPSTPPGEEEGEPVPEPEDDEGGEDPQPEIEAVPSPVGDGESILIIRAEKGDIKTVLMDDDPIAIELGGSDPDAQINWDLTPAPTPLENFLGVPDEMVRDQGNGNVPTLFGGPYNPDEPAKLADNIQAGSDGERVGGLTLVDWLGGSSESIEVGSVVANDEPIPEVVSSVSDRGSSGGSGGRSGGTSGGKFSGGDNRPMEAEHSPYGEPDQPNGGYIGRDFFGGGDFGDGDPDVNDGHSTDEAASING